jgi:hypothetical protein
MRPDTRSGVRQRDFRMPPRRKPSADSIVSGMPARITKLVEGESDRGVILILAAYLDELLADLLRTACVSPEVAEDILDVRRPAGDFESRISLCLAFGLIHPTEATALQAVRKIRNSAAHFDKKGRGFDVLFDSDSTIDQVGNLLNAVNLALQSREAKSVKGMFVVSCRLLATRIMLRGVLTRRAEVPQTIKEGADQARARAQGTPAGKRIAAIDELTRSSDLDRIIEFLKAQAAELQSKLQAKEPSEREEPDA